MRFHDASVAHAHQADAAHGIDALRAPDQPPSDFATIAAGDDGLDTLTPALIGAGLVPAACATGKSKMPAVEAADQA